MVGSINSGYQQQAPVFKSLNPGITRNETTQNAVQQGKDSSENASVSKAKGPDTIGAQKQAQPVLQVGEDTGLSSRSNDRGQNLDISV